MVYETIKEEKIKSPGKSPNNKRLKTADRASPGKVYRQSQDTMTRVEYEEEINYGLWEEGKRVMWFEKEF